MSQTWLIWPFYRDNIINIIRIITIIEDDDTMHELLGLYVPWIVANSLHDVFDESLYVSVIPLEKNSSFAASDPKPLNPSTTNGVVDKRLNDKLHGPLLGTEHLEVVVPSM